MRFYLFILYFGLVSFTSSAQHWDVDSLLHVTIHEPEEIDSLIEIAASFRSSSSKNMKLLSDKALNWSIEHGYTYGKARALMEIGFYYLILGEEENAITRLNESLLLAIDNNFHDVQAGNYSFLSVLYRVMENYEIALSHSFSFKDIALKEENENWITEANINIANIYLDINDPENAKKYLDLAFENFDFNDESTLETQGWYYESLATIYELKQDYPKGIEYSKKSIEIWKDIDHQRGLAFSYFQLSQNLDCIGSVDSSYVYLRKSLDLSTKMKYNLLTTKCYLALAKFFEKKDYDKSFMYASKAYSIMQNENFVELGRQICKHFIKLAQQRHDIANELFYTRELERLSSISYKRKQSSVALYSKLESEIININNENLRLIEEKSKKEIQVLRAKNNLFIAILIIFIAFLFLILYQRNLAKSNIEKKKLAKLNKQLSEQLKINTDQKIRLDNLNKQLSGTNKDLERFAGVVAHDIKAPLRTLSSVSQLLHKKWKGRLDSQDYKWLEILSIVPQNLTSIVDGILKLSKLDKNLGPPESLTLQSIIETTVRNLENDIIDANAKIEVEVQSTVTAHKSLLTELFSNLISNSLKYASPLREPVISVIEEGLDENIILTVEDNGIGIPENKITRIFDHLYRISTSEKEGFGIGLSVCKKIVDYYQGMIWVESVEGQGTSVKMKFKKNIYTDGKVDSMSPLILVND